MIFFHYLKQKFGEKILPSVSKTLVFEDMCASKQGWILREMILAL